MNHDRDTYPNQGRQDRQIIFSQKITHYAGWFILILIAGYKLTELW